jgi:cell division protein YceG involved in septum cleavage
MALLAIGGLAFIALVVVVIARGGTGGGEETTTPPVEAQRTTELLIPEGLNREQIADLLKEEGLKGDYEQETTGARGFNPSKYGADAAGDLEGFLFPATYEVFRRDDARDLVEKQLAAFEDNFSKVDLDYAKSKNLTPYDVLIIASMIEKEIALPEERRLAAAVIYNRLGEGMPLQIDATTRFATGNYDEPLTQSELDLDSPYNTRVNTGLPPGPIGNPGLASIEAAAKPAKSDALFYVIEPGTCNEHFFTDSEKEFQAAADEYQAALEAEGGSPTDC